ncbi:MAG: hypothetical protein M3Y87_11855 [Myxococcota bacterium]|nr:hypothetical protein [Myxococcota bacterium]
MVRELARALTILLVLAVSSLAAAQEPSAIAAPRRPDQLDPAAPLTLRPEPALRPLAGRIARMLELRAQLVVSVGDAPPPGVPEAVPAAHVGMVRDGPELFVALGGPQGLVYTSRVDLPAAIDPAVRAVALTVEALRDAAIEGPPPRTEGEGQGAAPGERVSFVYIEPEGGLFGVRRRIEPIARPTIYLRLLLGFSTARDTALVGPGVGLGLCIEMSCAVLEGDLPIIPEERVSPSDGRVVRYRPISLGLRLQIRPWRWGDFVPAVTLGVLTRFGNAWVDEVPGVAPSETQTVTDFGLRGTLELAWIFAEPFEIVIEGGVDFVANPARFVRAGEVVLLEDVVTVWGVTSFRLRP